MDVPEDPWATMVAEKEGLIAEAVNNKIVDGFVHPPMKSRSTANGAWATLAAVQESETYRGPFANSLGHVYCFAAEAAKQCLPWHRRRSDGKFDGKYVDCNFGRGDRCREILSYLSEDGRLFSFDADPGAVSYGHALEAEDGRFHFFHKPFADIGTMLDGEELSGVFVDLGVSSPQRDQGCRGLSFFDNAPLDLRVNPAHGISAADWLRTATREEIAWVILEYGEAEEDIIAERIAQAIDDERQESGPIQRTQHLADIVRKAKRYLDERRTHPAKLTFQAIRTFLNHEMQHLEQAMKSIFTFLEFGGRCAVISQKHRECCTICRLLREHEDPERELYENLADERLCELFPLLLTDKPYAIQQVQQPSRPSQKEIERNPRARSSVLHILQKVSRRSQSFRHAVSGVRPKEQRFVEPTPPPFIGGQTRVGSSEVRRSRGECLPSVHQRAHATSLADREACNQRAHRMGEQPLLKDLCGVQAKDGPINSAALPAALQEAEARTRVDLEAACPTTLYTVVVLEDVDGDDSGYLTLKINDQVHILYHGIEGDEADWLYGVHDDKCGKVQQGWVAASVCRQITQIHSDPTLCTSHPEVDPPDRPKLQGRQAAAGAALFGAALHRVHAQVFSK